MKAPSLRTVLRWLSAAVFAGVLALWLATGAHRGWTRTEITEMRRDEITGLDYPVQRAGLVAGVDLLGAGAGVAAGLLAGSLFTRRRTARPA